MAPTCAQCGASATQQCPTCLDLGAPVWYCSRACYQADWAQHKLVHRRVTPSEQPRCFQIQPVPGKGLGAVALRDIPKGARILAEPPLFCLPTATMHPARAAAAAVAAVDRLSPEQREQVMHLHPGVAEVHGSTCLPFRIFNNNALPLGEDAKEGGLFLDSARFNHSCTPNVHHSYNARIGMETLHASADIPAGTELVITYIPTDLPRAERQRLLSSQFGFTCTCHACSLQGAALEASDTRRRKLAQADDAVYKAVATHQFDLGLQLVNQTLDLLAKEGLDQPIAMLRCEYDAYQACKHAGRHRQARAWLEAARAHSLQAEGADSEDSLRFGRMLRLPTNAPHDPCYRG